MIHLSLKAWQEQLILDKEAGLHDPHPESDLDMYRRDSLDELAGEPRVRACEELKDAA